MRVDWWDLDGKLSHLWVHHFIGTNGILYIIDCARKEEAFTKDSRKKPIQDLETVLSHCAHLPFLFIINVKDK